MDQSRARRVVLQHLEGMRLAGADAAPLRGRERAGRAAAPERARPGRIEDRPVEAQAAPAGLIEPKPMVRGKSVDGPAPGEPLGGVLFGGEGVGAEGGAMGRGAGKAKRRRAPEPRDRSAAQARLEEIRRRYEADAPHEQFVTSFTNIVFGEGDPCARLMFIGEAPGEEEDRTGRPFVGRAGQLLDKMIQAMGLKREQVYIANVLKTRPPGNATPTPEEAALCAPYLFDQIEAVSPEVIVTLGLPATRLILGVDEAMSRLRGRWGAFTGIEPPIPVMPTYHPAYVLRQYTADVRGKVWSDLRLVIEKLGISAPEDR